MPPVITVAGLRKRFGSIVAVDSLGFEVQPGRVTGFLGPNGSGKSTTLRCMLGLDRPEAGTALFSGRPYQSIKRPLHEIGALLDAGYVHPGRSARNHLRWIAASNGISSSRADEVLEWSGLASVGATRVKGYSLGMRQRLGLAAVLLGNPSTVILDEPANGLDPEGMRWIRDVLVHLAGEGRTVFVSSHLLSEMAQMAEDLVVIGRGRLIEQGTVADFVDRHAERWVHVRSPEAARLQALLAQHGAVVREGSSTDTLLLDGTTCERVGETAAAAGIVLHELVARTGSLEEAFLRATSSEVEYHGQGAPR
ncbi:MAG: ATP-binding cassette domain-containing protein [Ilumatobacteraceae bacterium]